MESSWNFGKFTNVSSLSPARANHDRRGKGGTEGGPNVSSLGPARANHDRRGKGGTEGGTEGGPTARA